MCEGVSHPVVSNSLLPQGIWPTSFLCPGLISFSMDWLDFLAVQGTLKSLLQHHSSKASILRCSAFFMVQLSHPYMTTGKTIASTGRIFVGKVMSLFFNTLSRLVIAFLPRSKRLLIYFYESSLMRGTPQASGPVRMSARTHGGKTNGEITGR